MTTRTGPYDRDQRRFFVYVLSAGDGEVLYIGRSRNVANRLIAHHSEASNPDTMQAPRKAMWLMDVRKVDMTGPLTWNEAIALERRLIEEEQPFGNIKLTKRDAGRLVGGKRRTLRAVS